MENTTLLKANVTEKPKEYNYGLDIIRIIAMFFVVLVHSTSFYGFSVYGKLTLSKFLVGGGRYLSYSCIPLFIILTGYLNANKEPTLKYFKKIFVFLFEYFMCSLCILFFKLYCLKTDLSLLEIIKQLLNFSLAPYAWYVNMYIGLFLIAPFLNILYKNLKDKWQKILLIVILFFVVSLPSTSSAFGWNYWVAAYPILYYYIGTFLREFKPNFKKIYLIIGIILTITIEILLVSYLNTQNHSNIFCLIVSVLIFLLFYDLKTRHPSSGTGFFRGVANLSLSTFLLSYIFEALTSKFFDKFNLLTFDARLPYLVCLTPIKFVLSVMIAFLIHHLCKVCIWILKFVVQKINNSRLKTKTPE